MWPVGNTDNMYASMGYITHIISMSLCMCTGCDPALSRGMKNFCACEIKIHLICMNIAKLKSRILVAIVSCFGPITCY